MHYAELNPKNIWFNQKKRGMNSKFENICENFHHLTHVWTHAIKC